MRPFGGRATTLLAVIMVGVALGAATAVPFVPPPVVAPSPAPPTGAESPLNGLTGGPGGVPLTMILVIAMAGAATVALVLRGTFGRRTAPLAPADEGETVGFE